MKEDQKKSKRWCGYVFIILAVCLAGVSVIMFHGTRGTRLLYADVTLGSMYRFYWIWFILAIAAGVIGGFVLKKYPKQIKEDNVQDAKQAIKHDFLKERLAVCVQFYEMCRRLVTKQQKNEQAEDEK